MVSESLRRGDELSVWAFTHWIALQSHSPSLSMCSLCSAYNLMTVKDPSVDALKCHQMIFSPVEFLNLIHFVERIILACPIHFVFEEGIRSRSKRGKWLYLFLLHTFFFFYKSPKRFNDST